MRGLNASLSGIAGEYLVAGELSRLGYIASLTLKNSKGIDILASNEKANKSVGIQVKTNKGRNRMWVLDRKAEKYFAKNLFYVFVNLNDGGSPDFSIVPSRKVAKFAAENHVKWLDMLSRNGQKHKDTKMRKFIDKQGKYLNRWDLLGL